MRTSFFNNTALVGVALLAGCYQVTEQAALAGQDVHLTVLHTSDIHARFLPYFQVPGAIDRGLGSCSELQPFGGAARMQHLLKRERAKSQRVMHLDSGDVFQGAPIFNQFKGEVEMKVMAALAPDGVVIGNHEFDLGSANISNMYGLYGQGLFPMLAANYLYFEPNDPFKHNLASQLKPYEIINLNGLRVAIIGMGNTSSMTSIAHGGNSLGISALEPVEVVRAAVANLQGRVDLIFLVSHMGLTSRGVLNLAEDTEMITGYELVIPKNAVQPNWEVLREEPNGDVRVKVPGVVGVDAIFGGHLHIVLNPPKVLIDPAGREVLLVHSGAFAKFFGRADLTVRVPKEDEEAPYGAEIISHRYSLFPITGRIPKRNSAEVVACPEDGSPTMSVEEGNDNVDFNTQCLSIAAADIQTRQCEIADTCRRMGDACTEGCRNARRQCLSVPAPLDGEMLTLLDPYVQRLYQEEDLNKGFAFATDRIARFGLSGEDSQLGNLVADSMRFRNRVEAQFSMTNTLGIRTNMERGMVTVEEMFNIFPFENSLTTMFLSGVEVQELFDYVTERSAERGCQTQAQISGVTFTMNCAQALRNEAGPSCEKIEDCVGTDFEMVGTKLPVRCVASRCYKSPADDIMINNEPVNPTESYKVAVNDFIGRGGSGFEVLRRNTTKVNTNLSLRDALIDYMRSPPEEGGPGRVCGSKALLEPYPAPVRPFVSFVKASSPGVTCDTPVAGCSPQTGKMIECKETDTEIDFYCIPNDFSDPSSNTGDECDEIARETPVFGVTGSCTARPSGNCAGAMHCCEKQLGGGEMEATFYCVVPFCVDPPLTGRITRIVQ
jgi:2',3'-cyclic-nucleotide 2'-phosphodiesterase (5'-nucleotidase family)